MNTLSDKAVDASAFALPSGVGVAGSSPDEDMWLKRDGNQEGTASVRPTNEKEKRL